MNLLPNLTEEMSQRLDLECFYQCGAIVRYRCNRNSLYIHCSNKLAYTYLSTDRMIQYLSKKLGGEYTFLCFVDAATGKTYKRFNLKVLIAA